MNRPIPDDAIDDLMAAIAHTRVWHFGPLVISTGPLNEPARIFVERGQFMVRAFGWQFHLWTERGSL